ncbi:MAG TPA: hypothetical protein VFK86_14800 [Bauldia sp.]|nr:hypothetical protein [Bauldia sp.]
MKTILTAAAAASLAIALGGVSIQPAAAVTADQAQCLNARGSGDLNDIALFCGSGELPSTAVKPGTIVRGFIFNRSSGRDVGNAQLTLDEMNCRQARAENSLANIDFFCKR